MKSPAFASLILASLSFNAFALPESQPQPLLGELRSSTPRSVSFTVYQEPISAISNNTANSPPAMDLRFSIGFIRFSL